MLGELPDLPHLPEVPGRGPTAAMTGRALAVMAELGADLQPAGWRLTDAAGVDHRRARSLLGQDLDTLEEQAEGYAGGFKIQVAGPWTLAATVEKPRGDKVLSDHGARRELAQALAEGLRDHVADVRRRLPGVDRLVVQVDEPALAGVLAAKVPTASGFGRHRTVHPPEASDALGWVLDAITDEGAEPWVHACAPSTPLACCAAPARAGSRSTSIGMGAADHDVLAEALEAGETVALGVVPSTEPAATGRRRCGHRAGAALARHGRPRPGEVVERLVASRRPAAWPVPPAGRAAPTLSRGARTCPERVVPPTCAVAHGEGTTRFSRRAQAPPGRRSRARCA